MYCPCASPIRCQWIGIPGQRQVLTHAIELPAPSTYILLLFIAITLPAVEGLLRVGRSLQFDVAP